MRILLREALLHGGKGLPPSRESGKPHVSRLGGRQSFGAPRLFQRNQVIALLLIFIGVITPAIAIGAFNVAEFRYSKPVKASPIDKQEVVAVLLDSEVYAVSGDDNRDLRIVSDQTAETPFTLEVATEVSYTTRRNNLKSELVTLNENADNSIVAVFHLDEAGPAAGGLVLHTPLKDYEHKVLVEGSADKTTWKPLVTDAVVFDYSRFMDIRRNEIVLPGNSGHWIRLTITSVTDEKTSPLRTLTRERRDSGGNAEIENLSITKRPFRVDRVDFWNEEQAVSGERNVKQDWPVREFAVTQDAKAKTTEILVKSDREPLTELVIRTGSDNFFRRAVVQIRSMSKGKLEWRDIGSGTLSSIHFGTYQESELSLSFAEQRQREYRIVIHNADNPPLEIGGVTGRGPVQRAVFLASPGIAYSLYMGSESAIEPNYDIRSVLEPLRGKMEPLGGSLGPRIENPAFSGAAGKKWSMMLNTKWFLTGAIVVVVGALAWMLFVATKRIDNLPKA